VITAKGVDASLVPTAVLGELRISPGDRAADRPMAASASSCPRLVEAMGGRVRYEDAPGEAASFVVSLPSA